MWHNHNPEDACELLWGCDMYQPSFDPEDFQSAVDDHISEDYSDLKIAMSKKKLREYLLKNVMYLAVNNSRILYKWYLYNKKFTKKELETDVDMCAAYQAELRQLVSDHSVYKLKEDEFAFEFEKPPPRAKAAKKIPREPVV